MCDQNKPLAIVIPAYKDTFFAQTLESIANQTNKDFTLYVGDDASPYNISDIVDKYKDRIGIVYKRFEENAGGKDLVAQWTRCIELTQGEEWIWLFSDDDIMNPQCVESFYKEVKHAPLYDLYRFDVDIIDNDDNVKETCVSPVDVLTAKEYCLLNQKDKLNSFVVEYVFSRRIFEVKHGFQCFDLAWGSDIATWIKFGYEKGIKSIRESHIGWRASGINISTLQDVSLLKRKLNAAIDYLNWYLSFWNDKPDSRSIVKWLDKHTLKCVLGNAGWLTFSDCYNAFKRYRNCNGLTTILMITLFPMYLLKFKLLRSK